MTKEQDRNEQEEGRTVTEPKEPFVLYGTQKSRRKSIQTGLIGARY